MDVPNAPNPANHVQDQFVDAVQGPPNQAQGPAAPKSISRSCSLKSSSRSCKQQCSNWLKCTCAASTTTGTSTTSPYWSGGTCPLSILSNLDRKET